MSKTVYVIMNGRIVAKPAQPRQTKLQAKPFSNSDSTSDVNEQRHIVLPPTQPTPAQVAIALASTLKAETYNKFIQDLLKEVIERYSQRSTKTELHSKEIEFIDKRLIPALMQLLKEDLTPANICQLSDLESEDQDRWRQAIDRIKTFLEQNPQYSKGQTTMLILQHLNDYYFAEQGFIAKCDDSTKDPITMVRNIYVSDVIKTAVLNPSGRQTMVYFTHNERPVNSKHTRKSIYGSTGFAPIGTIVMNFDEMYSQFNQIIELAKARTINYPIYEPKTLQTAIDIAKLLISKHQGQNTLLLAVAGTVLTEELRHVVDHKITEEAQEAPKKMIIEPDINFRRLFVKAQLKPESRLSQVYRNLKRDFPPEKVEKAEAEISTCFFELLGKSTSAIVEPDPLIQMLEWMCYLSDRNYPLTHSGSGKFAIELAYDEMTHSSYAIAKNYTQFNRAQLAHKARELVKDPDRFKVALKVALNKEVNFDVDYFYSALAA